jgi:acetyltransferase-like isoleucine patch superfamily enzyme
MARLVYKLFVTNPTIIWFKWVIKTVVLLFKNRGKHIKVAIGVNIKNTHIGRYNTFYKNVKITNTSLGNYVYISMDTRIINATIGSFCSIAQMVKIGGGMHPVNHISTFPAFFSLKNQCQRSFVKKDCFQETGFVNIGNDVWIGSNAVILDNITIGDGAIIAAGAVVTKDVAPYSIVGGVPAKHIKFRFSQNTIDRLLELQWWNKSMKWIEKKAHLFTDINNLDKIIE